MSSRRFVFRSLLDSHHDRRVCPQFFKVIEIAHRAAEQVDDHAVVIEQDPAGLAGTFDAQRQNALLFQLPMQIVGDGFHLPRVVRRGDHKIIGDDRDRARVDQ